MLHPELSDRDDLSTTSSLNNNDDSTSPSTSTHCHMSNDNIKVNNDSDVVDHTYTCDELVDLIKDMSLYLEKVKTKKKNLKNENLILKNSCDHSERLLNTLIGLHEELKLTHEDPCLTHEKLKEDHEFLTKVISKEEIKNDESSSCDLDGQLQYVANSCDVGKKHVSTSCDDLLDMPCSSHIDACSTSMSCETNLLKENNELKMK